MKLETQAKDKTEITKQQIKGFQRVLTDKIKPQKNHTLFEVNLLDKTISLAEFEEIPPLEWHKAVKGDLSLNKVVTKKENCVYISSLNKENAIKILKRDFKIEL